MKLFSSRHRPGYLGPFPDERLPRVDNADLNSVPSMVPVAFRDAHDTLKLSNSMALFIAMLDTIRSGVVNPAQGELPDSLVERSQNIKGAGFFNDAAMVGICQIPDQSRLKKPLVNNDITELATLLETTQVKSLANGIDHIMTQLKESVSAPQTSISHHTHAVVFLYEYPRDPDENEPGAEWIEGTNAQRAALRAAETAAVYANYYRLLGYDARAHTATTSDVDLNVLAVASGLTRVDQDNSHGVLVNPFVGRHFGLAALTTTLELAPDQPLAPDAAASGLAYALGYGTDRRAATARPYQKRRFVDGALPFETIKRVKTPTTFIDEANVARVPKRADMFPRGQFGDFGPRVQDATIGGHMMSKNATGWASRAALGAFIVLQDGEVAEEVSDTAKDPRRNAQNIKAASYFLGVDAIGLSRCPDWAYYSHDAAGEPIVPYHKNAITMMIDQGRDSLEGSSGDDWLSAAQSMRAYLRNSILGGVIAAQIRSLGYSARVHSVVDGEVLQPPLSLLSGLGEVSRIGEVILHPLLGPRLKTGVVTTDMPFDYDDPIDFGLQRFCENCNKCARECPSGAITAGPKTMFNGYEIWKSDSQKCLTYRLTNDSGSMCGRCMKTCPWNLEGLFAEKPFRWAASNVPGLAPLLAKLDDTLGHGKINPVKKWWLDHDRDVKTGKYKISTKVNQRQLQPELDLRYEDQTLAVYPAHLAPHPYPYPFPADREAGIQAYRDMLTPEEYKRRLRNGEFKPQHVYAQQTGESPVLRLSVTRREAMTTDITLYRLAAEDGADLPAFTAGAHLDVVVAPEFFRQYSLCSDPAERSYYDIAVLREAQGRGGSDLLHRMFNQGRKVFVSRPINHFPLVESATRTRLFGGGIGVTPMIAMAHTLHALRANFTFHYSYRSREQAGFLNVLNQVDWASQVRQYNSSDGSRADLEGLVSGYGAGEHLYVCGPDPYMQAVIAAATAAGWPEDALHAEYFTPPELPEYENHDFKLKLARSDKIVEVAASQSATDALYEAGVHVDVKCSDGLCGVCSCGVLEGEVEHRDFVLSAAQRKTSMILCQSRAADKDGVVVIDL
ncbi:MAG: reductive dehalogenase [Gammaproteobacteria bacterium]